LSGCHREEVSTSRVAKETEKAPEAPQPQIASGVPSGSGQVKWKLPSGWEQLPPSDMRVGSFQIQGKDNQQAEVSIIPLGGPAGGELGNVNRWREQVGLGKIDASELAKLSEKVTIGTEGGTLFDLAGVPPEETDKKRILAAMVKRGETTWFFKMTGADALVEQQKSVFVGFLKDVSFSAGPADSESAAVAPPAVPLPIAAPNPTSEDNAKPAWTVPAGWQEKPAGMMQLAKFAVTGDNAKAEVTVASFPGDTGGTLANVNRWRTQLGLSPVDQAGLANVTTPLDLGGTKALLVDMANPDKKSRLVAAMVPRGANTWFYKLMGDEAIVARETNAFVQFVRSAK
jgi:hypothetical protein